MEIMEKLAFRSVSYNTLSDPRRGSDPRHTVQSERLGALADAINHGVGYIGRVAVFLCEVATEENFVVLERDTDLSIVDQPFRCGDTEFLGFLADKETARRSKAAHHPVDERYGDHGAVQLIDEEAKLSIVGGHPSSKLRAHRDMRKAMFDLMLQLSGNYDHAIIEGDLNTPQFFPDRRALEHASYERAHGLLQARFPIKEYRGVTAPAFLNQKYVPLAIDGIYAKNLEKIQSGEVRSTASDHPLLWAEYEVR